MGSHYPDIKFFIPGAPKCGTTFAQGVLSRHDSIFIPASKEPNFLSKDPEYGQYHRGWGHYRKNFVGAGDGCLLGEASTIYFYDESSAGLIKYFYPSAKLIFFLRDPADRLYSSYWQYVKSGRKLPGFEVMVKEGHPRFEHMAYVTRYDIHLKRFFRMFPGNQIMIILFEDLRKNPLKTLNGVARFLGLENGLDESSLVGIERNVAGVPRSQKLARALRQVRFIQQVKQALPARTIAPARYILQRARKLNTRPIQYPPLPTYLREELTERYLETFSYLEGDLGIDLNKWAYKS